MSRQKIESRSEVQVGRTWVFARASEYRELLRMPDVSPGDDLSRVMRLRHRLVVDKGQTLQVTEHFTVGSWLRRPRRAVLFLNGSVFRGDSWSIPAAGYDATSMMARRGMFVWTVDFIGSGDSSQPSNGLAADLPTNVEALRGLLQHIHIYRDVCGIDLVGEGYGGMMAVRLAADPKQVRTCVLTNTLYKDIVGGPATSPEMVGMLENSPDGYFPIPPEAYDPFMAGAPGEVRDYIHRTQPGSYPTPSMLVITGTPPFFDPSIARAPGLVLFGEKDFVLGPNDAANLADDYGQEGAKLMTHAAGGHSLRLESPAVAEWFWNQVIDFIDP